MGKNYLPYPEQSPFVKVVSILKNFCLDLDNRANVFPVKIDFIYPEETIVFVSHAIFCCKALLFCFCSYSLRTLQKQNGVNITVGTGPENLLDHMCCKVTTAYRYWYLVHFNSRADICHIETEMKRPSSRLQHGKRPGDEVADQGIF